MGVFFVVFGWIEERSLFEEVSRTFGTGVVAARQVLITRVKGNMKTDFFFCWLVEFSNSVIPA